MNICDVKVPYGDVAKFVLGNDVENTPDHVQCVKLFGFSGVLWAVLNTAVSTKVQFIHLPYCIDLCDKGLFLVLFV